MCSGKFFPRIGFALLHAEGDTTTFFVDFEDHDFNFFAKLNDFLRINVLVCPIHFGNVDQTFNTGFDFNESTVVSDVGNLTEETCALRITAGDTDPRIFAELFDTERNTVLFLIELQNLSCDFLTCSRLRSDDERGAMRGR